MPTMVRRSRSRSPGGRDRRRSRSRDRERRHRRRRSRSPRQQQRRRSRSASPRRRSRSPNHRRRSRERDVPQASGSRRYDSPPPAQYPAAVPQPQYAERPKIDESQLEGKSAEEIEMMKLMGFGNFDTTKGKKVAGNEVGQAAIIHKRKYRQYMNRRGGFNRPLDFIA